MDYSQARLGLHHDGAFSFGVSGNVSSFSFSPYWTNRTFEGRYTTVQTLLLLVPSAVLLLLCPLRLIQLRRESLKVLPNKTGAIKALLTLAIAAVELAALVLCLTPHPRLDDVSIATHAVAFVTSLAICQLSFIEHGRSVRPSTVLTFFLLVSVLCEGVLLRSLYRYDEKSAIPPVLTAIVGLKFLLFIVESLSKRPYLREPYRDLPVEQAVGYLNRAILFWVSNVILLGNSKLLSVSDLPSLDDALRSEHMRARMAAAWEKTSKPNAEERLESARSLLTAWFSCFASSLLLNAIPRSIQIVFRYAQPILINRAIIYISNPTTELRGSEADSTGYNLIIATIIIYIGIAVSHCVYRQGVNRIAVQTRGGFVGLIHARCLTMRDGVYDDAAAVTHMSNDVDNIDSIGVLFQETWAQLIEVAVGMFMLWNELGWWCLTPLAIVGLCYVGARLVSSRVGKSMTEWQMAKQKRIAITTSMIDYMKNIKMMGMANTVMTRIQDSRLFEIAKGNNFRWMVVYFNMTANALGSFAPVITLVVYAVDAWLRGHDVLDPTKAFTAISIISLVTAPANSVLSVLPQFASIIGCAQRIQKYLLEPSREDHRLLIGSLPSKLSPNGVNPTVQNGQRPKAATGETVSIILDAVSLRPAASAEICLEDVTASMAQGSLNVICGAVGTGKTTLVRAILGDIPLDSGTISVSSKRISYCAQKPWLINASIKAIICGPVALSDIDEEWYKTVVRACGLEEDIALLSGGDSTTIGSRGVTLSGGQRQRVAIARAVFSRPSIIILDDVLSALDAKTEALVANQLLGRDGIFRRLDTTVLLITHATQHLPLADHIMVLAESRVAEQGTWNNLRSSTGYISKLQVRESSDSSTQHATANKLQMVPGTAPPSRGNILDLTRKVGDASVYLYYFKSASIPIMILFIFFNATYGVMMALTPSILRSWSESGGRNIWLYVAMYSVSSALLYVCIVGVIWSAYIKVGPTAGKVLHYILLKTIIRAPLSYFATTDTGEIVNRFSQDINLVDQRLATGLMIVALHLFRLLSQLFLLFITQASMTLSLPFLLCILYFTQKIYLHTSRQIRFLDIELRAAVYSNFLETLEGISTIRALGWQSQTISQNIERLDVSQTPAYAISTIQQWLVLVLDMLVAGLAMLVISLAVALRATTTGGQIGMALNVLLVMSSTLVRLLEQWTDLETSLGAVARIKSLEATLVPEDKEGEYPEPAEEWPEKGAIEFQDVTASYNPETTALKEITLKFSPGQKVGICGRTGSGKSTLLLSMLRLIELDSGSISIDGLDLATLERETIRSRLIAIPQETFVLNDSIRLNIDPSGTVSDADIIAALGKVQLWNVLKSRGSGSGSGTAAPSGTTTPANEATPNGGISTPKEDTDPLAAPLKSSPFSHGQFQLFGLARALLLKKRSTILILDEATSNVDTETDALMQRIIREEFAKHTILSVAHRLDTIRDADVVIVLNQGRVVEVGAPGKLLEKKKDPKRDGGDESESSRAWFKEMWDDAH